MSEKEPFGWKIGVRDKHSKFAREQERKREERNVLRLRN
jgi:hypothetical protein